MKSFLDVKDRFKRVVCGSFIFEFKIYFFKELLFCFDYIFCFK